MKLSDIKIILDKIEKVEFVLPNGENVPQHFHVTEIGRVEKKFVDCGGTLRKEVIINFQLWTADDYDHRLSAQKLKSIVEVSEKELLLDDLEIEVEYQSHTIGKYHLDYRDGKFMLKNTKTECLAGDSCLIPDEKNRVNIVHIDNSQSNCNPESGCC
jgi:hypothetical protein